MAGNTDDIEREIMLEMEKEIQRTQAQSSNNNGSSNAAGVTTTTALHQDAAATLASNAVQHALTSSHMTEEEQIQAEIEERLRRKREARRETEQQARREAEQQQARREAEQQARREAEQQARREAEQQARREAEQQARREAEQQQARREAEQQARREAEQQARREAEQQARREAEEQARREAEQQARREAEQQARREAEQQARREAEQQQARREAEQQARREAEQQARREAEQQARREAEEQARREAEQQQARREAEQQQARREAEQQQARREAEQQARREAKEQARREAEQQARREAHEAALEEIRRKAREEVFAAYAAKSRQASLAASPLTASAEQQAVAAVNAATSTNTLTSTTSSFAHAATTTTATRTRDEHVDKASEGSHGGARRHYRSAYDDDSNDGDDSDITSDENDNDAASHSDAESSGYSADALAALRNDNGLCARTEQDSSVDDSDFVDAPLASFEAVRQRECARRARSPAAQQQQQQQDDMHAVDDDDDDAVGVDCVDVHRYGTIREPGRCLFPPDEVRGTVPAHAKVQLGFFRARQLILSRATHLRHRRVADRERASEGDERALSTLTCYFEHELLQDRDLTVDDEDCAHNAPREQLLRRDDVQHDGEAAIRKAVSSISYGDPIQVWERVCHGGSATTTTTSEGNNSSSNNSGDDVTGEHMWVSGIDTRKPVPAMRTFTGGRVVRVVAQKLASGVVREHGEGSDPLVVALAFYSLADNANMKVSETFYFDAAVDVFYPHKQRSELARENVAVAFIPAEFMPSLYLVARVYRPCSDDFDSFVDLYTRPERYKASHVAPMKQETLLLARESDVLEELGWFAVPCVSNDTAKTLQPRLTIAQLYRKPLNDVDLLRLAPDARTRGTLRTVPIDVHLTLQDVSAHEVAFPSAHADPLPTENETLVSLLDPDVPGARARVYRYAPCCIPILNSGYFTEYTNVYYLRLRVMRVIVTGALRSALPSSMSSHRTFALHLCVKERDDSLSEDDGAVLRCIYGRGLGALTLDTHAWSSSVSGASEFALSDEYKLQLPLNLTDRHHVFFTLYALCPRHGSGSVGSSSSNSSSSYRVGYAALPLLVDGAVHVRDHIDLRFVAHEHAAVAAAGGYLASFAKAPASAFLNNGDVALTLATQARTSVHASNRVIASVFRLCPPSLDVLRRDDDVLARSGELTRLAAAAAPPPPPLPSAAAAAAAAASSSATPYDPHRVVITYISQLPLAEVLAFYPFLSAYAFALIGSGAGNVTLASRTHMLDVLLLITTKAQQYDTNASTIRRRHGSVAVADVFTRTSVASVLYHFFSNNVLYDSVDDNNNNNNNNSRGGGRFRVYAGLVETWLNLLRVTAAQATSDAAAMTTTTTAAAAAATTSSNNSMTSKPATATASARNLNREMSDLSWFLFDAILRSVYLWCDEHGGARSARFDVSFYSHVAELCVTVLRQLSTYDESTLVRRVAVFVRNLMHCCDRGHMLAVCERVLRYLDEQSNYESMTNFLRYVLADHALVAALLRPCTRARQPVFLTRLLVGSFATLLTHSGSSHTARSLACDVLYGFVRRLADDAAFTSAALTSVATQLFPLVRSISMQWRALPPVSATTSNSHNSNNNNGDADNKAAVPTTAAAAALAERRQLAMALLWVLYYTPSAHTRQWLRGEADAKAIVGVMHMVTNAQSLFRYTAGHDKAADGGNDGATTRTGGRVADGGATAATATANNNNTNMLTSANAASNRSTASLTTATMTSAADNNNNNISTMTLAAPSSSVVVDASARRAWDGRHATLVTAMGTQLGSLVLHTLTTVLRTVKEDKASVCVFPFFTLLESVLHLGNSTASLQMSAALLHATVCQLFPEIISRKAAMSSGMVLLTFRLMSSCCQYVRSSASWTFLLMCQAYFTWTRSLSKMKSLTANALVSVAESKTRDLRLAGRFIEFQFDDLVDAAAVEEANYVTPSAGFASRFEDDTHAASGDTLMRYKHDVEALPLSVQPVVPISRYLLDAPQPGTRSRSPRDGHNTSNNSNKNDNNDDDARHGSATPRFSDDFAAMTRTVLSLFNDVLLLQVDSSLQFKEAKVFAYFDVFRNFLRQNALKESLRWLYRLHDAHKANEDMVEAGMVLVFIAALCFRVTEVFYRVKGRHSRGARMPYGVLTRVFWHDYVRILPELEALLPADTVHAIVSELYVCPDDACFTMEGQVRTLKEAAEYQDKGQYYEFSLATIGIVNVYLDALHDYKSAAVVHAAMHTWCSAIAEHTPRTSNRYFLLWARMERAESSSSSSWSSSSSRASPSTSRKQASSSTTSSSPASSKHHTTSTAAASSSSAAAAASPLAVDDGMVGERPRGLPGGAAVRRVYKLPATTRLREFAAYARAYVVSLFDDDDALVIATDEPTETLPALPEPDSKRKRVAAVHRAPNHCLLTVYEVQPRYGVASASDDKSSSSSNNNSNSATTTTTMAAESGEGDDKTRHVRVFEYVHHAGLDVAAPTTATTTAAAAAVAAARSFDVMAYRLSISTYELDRAFPSTTTAIDVAATRQTTLNAYETAVEVLNTRRECIDDATAAARSGSASEAGELIVRVKEALCVRGLLPGVYMKEVVLAMSSQPDVDAALRALCASVRAALVVCDAHDAASAHPEAYALVLKAITDVECCLIATEATTTAATAADRSNNDTPRRH